MYSIFEQLLQKYGVSTYKVSKDTGIAQSVFSSWKNGISTPKADKIQKTREIAQEIFENPDLKSLFEMSRKMPPERLRAHIEFMKKMQESEK